MTNNELVSRITNGYQLLNKDDRINRRYILQVARQTAKFLISQKLRDKSLFREDNLYTTIDCFELESKDRFVCDIVEFRSCEKLMKSVKPLPDLIYSRYGNSIKEVTAIDYHKEFKKSTISQFRRDKKREMKADSNFYYVRDNYLYLPDSEVEMVSLYVMTVDEYLAQKSSSCNNDPCKSAWEYEFNIPDKLLTPLFDMVRQEVGLHKQIVEDTNPNLDENQKAKTTP